MKTTRKKRNEPKLDTVLNNVLAPKVAEPEFCATHEFTLADGSSARVEVTSGRLGGWVGWEANGTIWYASAGDTDTAWSCDDRGVESVVCARRIA